MQWGQHTHELCDWGKVSSKSYVSGGAWYGTSGYSVTTTELTYRSVCNMSATYCDKWSHLIKRNNVIGDRMQAVGLSIMGLAFMLLVLVACVIHPGEEDFSFLYLFIPLLVVGSITVGIGNDLETRRMEDILRAIVIKEFFKAHYSRPSKKSKIAAFTLEEWSKK